MNAIWIAWEEHRRTKELCIYFNVKLFILESELPRIIKYPVLIYKTIKILTINKPKILFVQNPSIVLAILCCYIKHFFKFKLVTDLHNAAIVPESSIQKILLFVYKKVFNLSDINIVTNSNLLNRVITNNVKIVLPDKLPDINSTRGMIISHNKKYFVSVWYEI